MMHSLISTSDFNALLLSVRLALITTLILLLIGMPLAYWLAKSKSVYKTIIEAIVTLPIVLPPTVLGFYLLIVMGANGWLGRLWQSLFGTPLAFTFSGLVIGSVLYSMPFVVRPLQNAFTELPKWKIESAATMGAGPIDRFIHVVLPSIKNGLLTAITLGFAHTLGEFGVVLMIGGNIPGKTQVVSIAIYDHVEQLQFAKAHILSLILLIIAFACLLGLYLFNLNRSNTVLK